MAIETDVNMDRIVGDLKLQASSDLLDSDCFVVAVKKKNKGILIYTSSPIDAVNMSEYIYDKYNNINEVIV